MSAKPTYEELEQRIQALEGSSATVGSLEEEIENIFQLSPDLVGYGNLDGYFTKVNSAFKEFLGYGENDFYKNPFLSFIHKDDIEATKAALMKARDGKQEIYIENRYLCKDGSYKWIEWHVKTCLRKNRFVAIGRNITERRKAELGLAESEQRWQFALEGAGDGVWDWNARTNRVFFSRQWKTMLGFELHEIGDNIDEWDKRIHPEDRGCTYEKLNSHLAGETPVYISEHRLRCKDGTYKWVLNRGKVVDWTEDGNPLRVIGTHTDISDRKRTESKLKEVLEETRLLQNETAALFKAAKAIPICRNFDEAARIIFDTCKDLIGARSGYVALPSEDGSKNEVLFLDAGGLPCDIDPELPMPIRGLREVAYNTGDVIYDNNFCESPWMKYMPPGHAKLDNVLFATINIKGKTEGVIGLANKPGGFTKKDAQLAAAFGDLGAVALRYALSQENLKKSESRHKSIIQTALDGFCRTDETGRILEVNPSYSQMSGYSEGELLRMRIQDLEFNENSKEVASHLRSIVENGQDRFESSHRRKNGTLLDVEVIVQYRKDDDRQFVSFIRDITKKKRQERALNFQALLLDQIQDHITATDLEGKIIYINEAECKSMKMSKGEIIGRSVEIYGENRENGATQQQIIDATQKFGEWRGEVTNYASDGTEIVMDCRTKLIKDEFGTPVSMVGISTDITEQKMIGARLQQAQKMESIGNLAGGIAHDFNNILFPIVGMAEILLEDLPEDSPEYENARQILKAGLRGSDLVKQILAFSRRNEQCKMPVRIQEILKEVLTLTRATIPAYIEITEDIQPDCGLAMADPTQIHQIAMNLITNAYHAVETKGGSISITLKETEVEEINQPGAPVLAGKCALMSVSDTGSGIDPEIINKIFEPYFTTKEQSKGTGLGLSVVYGIVKDHHGDVKVYSEEGKGAKFNVYLPIMEKGDKSEFGNPKALLCVAGSRRTNRAVGFPGYSRQRFEWAGYGIAPGTGDY